MFAYDGRELPTLRNYGDAYRCWDNATQWRGETHEWDKRKLDGNKRHVTIRKGNNHQIICRLHNTDVVVYHSDGRIDVDCSWGSRSTDAFIWSLLSGSGVSCNSNDRRPVAWITGGGGYHFTGNVASFKRDANDDWQLLNPAPMFTFASKPKVTKQLRMQYGYDDFLAWRKMFIFNKGEPDYGWKSRDNPAYRPNDMHGAAILRALSEKGEEWGKLATKCSADFVLQFIYRQHPECVAVAERGPFLDVRDHMNWKTLDRKYGWALKGQ
jgi:hypothetical protein